MRAISITMDLMFQLKVLRINETKDIINISNCTLHIVKLFIGFDAPFLANFCRFSERGCQFMR